MDHKKKKKKSHRGFWIFVKVQIFLMLLVGIAVGYYYIGGYAKEVKALREEAESFVKNSDESTFSQIQTTEVYDVHGDLISTIIGDKDVYYVSFQDIPADVVNAIISIEDKKFYKHIGIDFEAIARAVVAMIRNGSVKQGGSTITQQLARTVFLSNDRTWERKVEEIYIALGLERKYTKDQIIEFYLNNVYFGNGNYGIEAASRGYFGCSINELDLSQIAYLCGLPNNPKIYDPLTHLDNGVKRRNRVLYQMYKDEVLTESRYKEAKSEKIELKLTKRKRNDYVETYTYYCVIRELMKQRGFQFKNFFDSEAERKTYQEAYDTMYAECQKTLFSAGYRIYTSIDLKQQAKLQKAIDNNLSDDTKKTANGTYKFQGAGVCIDNITGRVVAIVGGRKQKAEGYTLNRAFQSFRQPGSSIKPLIVYTPSFENGYTPDSIVEDKKIEGGPTSKSYLGKMTIRSAVEKSRNSVAWQLFDEITPEVGLQYLLDMNFSKIHSNDYYLPAALGGMYHGVSALEMASGYATIANDGFYRTPTCIVKVTDAKGNIILQTEQEEKAVYKTNAARMMTDVMQGVLTRGTAKGKGLKNMPTAGKTGTTNENKDGWFVGYSYYYTTSIWVGYDKPTKLSRLQGATYPAQIWHDYMEQLHKGLEKVKFKSYVDYDNQEVDSEYDLEETKEDE
ncbi:MAG: PBP1A family penicillin-binding protein [Lachnospiraceae bacterium]|nr:PBP1A family penicillin-binding protein [Lachnospiraceae bacterium]